MSAGSPALLKALESSRTRVVFGAGRLSEAGRIVGELGARHVMLITDPGIVAAGHADRAREALLASGFEVTVFSDVEENPTTEHVDAGVHVAMRAEIDFLVGLGGGSSMDCAKGINFILTNGGRMQDYRGEGKALKPMLPSVGVPTTAGTGSEAQSFALITEPQTKRKMACGDEKAAFRVAILDPDLTVTQPPAVAAAAAMDAVSHAVETAGTTRRNDLSIECTREAWRLLDRAFERALSGPDDLKARSDMLLGAHYAGAAIEASMLGAAHALANPLTQCFGISHGVAVGLMLPHTVRYNTESGRNPYAALCADPDELLQRVLEFQRTAGLPRSLADCGVTEDRLPDIAREAAAQWTARFNPRPVNEQALLDIYHAAGPSRMEPPPG